MDTDMTSRDQITSQLSFLSRDDKFYREKPYILRFRPEDGFPMQNTTISEANISLTDIRYQPPPEYRLSGLGVIGFETGMQYEDFDNHEKITNIYLQELEAKLVEYFPGSTVDFVSYLVSIDSMFTRSRFSRTS